MILLLVGLLSNVALGQDARNHFSNSENDSNVSVTVIVPSQNVTLQTPNQKGFAVLSASTFSQNVCSVSSETVVEITELALSDLKLNYEVTDVAKGGFLKSIAGIGPREQLDPNDSSVTDHYGWCVTDLPAQTVNVTNAAAGNSFVDELAPRRIVWYYGYVKVSSDPAQNDPNARCQRAE